ncbi:uncharacterized protein LOC121964483, partial [Plectropomus leopardus]|uniref:uncharacterized protein LOC121964483 n=1 Tax=Plectropomus leopardus TaxID=160734 RepID=UPI001C4B0B8B
MNDELSPDFVLMRLVSAAEYDRLDEPEELLSGGGGFGPVKAALGHRDSGGPSPGLGSASPHYSSPLPGKGELEGGLVLPQAPPGSEGPRGPPPPEDFTAAAQRFVDFPVSRGPGGHGSLMVFENLLRSGDRILDCGLERAPPQRQQLDSGPEPGSTVGTGSGGGRESPHSGPPAEEPLQPRPMQWPPVLRQSRNPQQDSLALDPGTSSVLCPRHRLLTERLGKWPPSLLEPALRLALLEPRKTFSPGGEDPVLALARRLGQLGEGGERGGGVEEAGPPLSRCSCHSLLAPGTVGEDPSETSDALLVLE